MSDDRQHIEPSAPRRAGRREWIGLAVIALPGLLYAMDLTVLFLAVPALARELDPSSSQLLWITDIYGFLIAGLLVTMGTLGDRIGRRRLLMWGAAAFGAASVIAAFSTSAEMLIAARAALGIAGATLAPSMKNPGRSVAMKLQSTRILARPGCGSATGNKLRSRRPVKLEWLTYGAILCLRLFANALNPSALEAASDISTTQSSRPGIRQHQTLPRHAGRG